MDPDALVRAYLGSVEAAASDLSAERRAELVGDLREHVALALAEEDRLDEAAVRRVLERIGTADEILAAERELPGLGTADRVQTETRLGTWWRGLSTEAKALGFLTIGAVALPFVGPLAGLWFVSGSEVWTLAQKRTAALAVLVLLALPAVLILPGIASGELTWVVTSAGFALPLVPLAGLVAAGYLVLSSPASSPV
jgi:hypothetical protein